MRRHPGSIGAWGWVVGVSTALLHVTTACTSDACDSGGRQCGGANALPIPVLLAPTGTTDGMPQYDLTAASVTADFGPGLRGPALGYNGHYLGPTLRLRRGQAASFTLHNNTDAMTSLHWHGMRGPQTVDVMGPGLMPGGDAAVSFRPDQPAATLWYHPHQHMDVGRQIYMGLSGLVILDDDDSDALPIPKTYGVDDIPLIVQDRRFTEKGAIVYHNYDEDEDGMLGNRIAVNGAVDAFANVPAALVRLRILNGSNARTYDFALSNGHTFWQIASDGGFLSAPVALTDMYLYPGERAEVLVDFAHEVEPIALVSLAFKPPGHPLPPDPDEEEPKNPADPAQRPPLGTAFKIIDFHVVPASSGAVHDVPTHLVAVPEPDMTHAVNIDQPRRFMMEDTADLVINGKLMDPADQRIDEHVHAGDTEVWFVNNHAPDLVHPFHVHGGQFRILNRSSGPVLAGEQGYKDIVALAPDESATLLVHFDGLQGKYYYHCHVYEHEDRGMMGTFAVEASATTP